MAIVDRGIRIRSSLRNNPHLDTSDDKKSINYSLMPAVSGKTFKGSRNRTKGHWKNSGFGLYMTSRIARNGGNFFIASGGTGMLLTAGKGGKRYFRTALAGTAIRLTVQTDRIEDLKGSLEQYRNEGYEIQKMYEEIVDIDPSAASMILSQNFSLSTWDRLLRTVKSAT